jgi:pyridoxamine 5'-phosphate oxidase family protein
VREVGALGDGRVSVFSAAELAYLASQRLGRLATAVDGQPHVVPISFRYNAETDTIDLGGHGLARSKKFRDVQRNPRVAFVVDDVPQPPPWRPRMVEIRGTAVTLPSGGDAFGLRFDPQIIRITPVRIASFGIDAAERGPRAVHSRVA